MDAPKARKKGDAMNRDLELLLDRSRDYQDLPFEWMEAWAATADMHGVLCYRGQELVSWNVWASEVAKGLFGWHESDVVDIIKESALDAMNQRSAPGRDFGAMVRLDAWYQAPNPETLRQFEAMCDELIDIHREYNLGCAIFESFDQWRRALMKAAPQRIVSL